MTAPQTASRRRSAGRLPIAILGVGLLLGSAPPPSLPGQLSQAVRAGGASIPALGVEVVDLATGRSVYAYHADRPLVPASNVKLLTTAAALDQLGAAFEHRTPLLSRGLVDPAGALHGDLAVRGSGDPNFSGRHENLDPYAPFRRWARALQDRGVRSVLGDLYLDHGRFDAETVHPDWPPDQLMWWYEAPVAALSFNDNCQTLRAWGGAQPAEPAVVELLPRLEMLRLEPRLTTTGQRARHAWKVHRDHGSPVVEVSGALLANGPPVVSSVTVDDPVLYFGLALQAALAEEGILLRGELRPVDWLAADGWSPVAEQRTPLLTTIQVANKRSQNFYAESLVKLLGGHHCGRGSWAGGTEAVTSWLVHRVGLSPDEFTLTDGSGMARTNRLTPRQLTTVLRFMFHHRWGFEYLTSLPYGGEPEASLHERFDAPPYRENVFAKTGSLTGVSSLSGYAKATSGRLYAFSILSNRASVWQGRRVQDRIVRALIDHG